MNLADVVVPANATVGHVYDALKEQCKKLNDIEFALIHESAVLRLQTTIKDAALRDGSTVSVLRPVPDFSGQYSTAGPNHTTLYIYSEGQAVLEEMRVSTCAGKGRLAKRARVGTWALRVVDSPLKPGVKDHIIAVSLAEEFVEETAPMMLRRRISARCTLKAWAIERPTKLTIEDYVSILDEENPKPKLVRATGGGKAPLVLPPVMGDSDHWFQKLELAEPSSEVPLRLMGISLRYLSDEFADAAKQRTGLPSPTFYDLKANFWNPKTLTPGEDCSEASLFNCDDKGHNYSHGLVTGQQVVLEDGAVSHQARLKVYVRTLEDNRVTFHNKHEDAVAGTDKIVEFPEVSEVHPMGFNSSNVKACMSDLKPGCSIIDTLAHEKSPDVGMASAYVSWVWKYPIDILFSALQNYVKDEDLNPATTYFWICFFQNNQHRIITDKKVQTAETLGEVFSTQLQDIGRMVLILDDWQSPQYCSRVWTLFEAYQGLKNGVPITAVFPDLGNSATELGLDGCTLQDAVDKICSMVDVETAEAWQPEDKAAILDIIRGSYGGSDNFNAQVQGLIWDALMNVAKQVMRPVVLKDPEEISAAKTNHQKLQMYKFIEAWHKTQGRKHSVAVAFARSGQRKVEAVLDSAGGEG